MEAPRLASAGKTTKGAGTTISKKAATIARSVAVSATITLAFHRFPAINRCFMDPKSTLKIQVLREKAAALSVSHKKEVGPPLSRTEWHEHFSFKLNLTISLDADVIHAFTQLDDSGKTDEAVEYLSRLANEIRHAAFNGLIDLTAMRETSVHLRLDIDRGS